MFERRAPEQFDTLPEIPEPCENPNLAGHAAIADRLAAAYRAGKLPHGLLFVGPPGIGKATLAFRLAVHVLAHPDPATAPERLAAPDRAGQTARLVAQGAHPAVLHLTRPYADKEKRFKTMITVDEVRRVNRFLSLTAHDGSHRFVIVDPVDDMNANAANALLKNLEEPPARTVFVLIAQSAGRLLPTIRSRCQVMRFQPLDDDALLAALEGAGADLPQDPAARRALAGRSLGSARNAILLTQYGGLEIAAESEALLSTGRFDIVRAQRLADALTGRDKAVQFTIFNRHLFDLVAARAAAAAEAGDVAAAAHAARLCEALTESVRQAETYNLDRRQHVVGTLQTLHAAFAGRPAN